MANERINIILSATDSATPQLQKFNRELNQTKQATRDLSGQGAGNMGGFAQLGASMNAAIAGIGVAGFAQVVTDLNAIGTQAQGMASIFDAMAGSTSNADKLLNQLRATTGNVVSDFDLMAGASQIMRMGLADNAGEVNELIEMAVRLKKPTESASEAIENFSLMLANQSVMRLDSFGISSGRVRDRINELLESGQALNREEAFTMAVMEEGATALDRLGDAAYISDTALNRLTTRLENARGELGKFVATGLEAGAMLGELFATGVDSAQEGNLNDFITAAVIATVQEFDPELGNSMADRQAEVSRQRELEQNGYISTISDPMMLMGPAIQQQMAAQLAIVQSTPQYQHQLGRNDLMRQMGQFQGRFDTTSTIMDGGRGNFGLMSPSAITSAISAYEDLQQMASNIESSEFVSDHELMVIGGMVEQAKGFADEAQRAKDLFEDMSLDEMLGKGDGGRLGELSDLVMANLSEGADTEGIGDDFDLATGRQTELGQTVEDQIAPQIAAMTERLGTEAGVTAMNAVLRAIENGQVNGMSQENIGVSAQFAAFQTSPFAQYVEQGASSIGTFMGQVSGDMGGNHGEMLGDMDSDAAMQEIYELDAVLQNLSATAEGVMLQGLENSSAVVSSTLDAALATIENLAADRTVTVKVNVKKGETDPEAVEALGGQMSNVTANNGGVVPYGNGPQ